MKHCATRIKEDCLCVFIVLQNKQTNISGHKAKIGDKINLLSGHKFHKSSFLASHKMSFLHCTMCKSKWKEQSVKNFVKMAYSKYPKVDNTTLISKEPATSTGLEKKLRGMLAVLAAAPHFYSEDVATNIPSPTISESLPHWFQATVRLCLFGVIG